MILILLIEDDLDDVELLEEALQNQGVEYKVDVMKDGKDAVDHIRSAAAYPHLIILDLNLPKIHGRQVLMDIKSTEGFKEIPLLILTTSSAKEDMDFCLQNGADKYIVKPRTIEEINAIVAEILRLAGK